MSRRTACCTVRLASSTSTVRALVYSECASARAVKEERALIYGAAAAGQGTPGYSRVLLGYSRVLQGTLGYSRVPCAGAAWHVRHRFARRVISCFLRGYTSLRTASRAVQRRARGSSLAGVATCNGARCNVQGAAQRRPCTVQTRGRRRPTAQWLRLHFYARKRRPSGRDARPPPAAGRRPQCSALRVCARGFRVCVFVARCALRT